MSCLYDNYIRSIEQTSLAFFDTSIVNVVKYSCDGYYSLLQTGLSLKLTFT